MLQEFQGSSQELKTSLRTIFYKHGFIKKSFTPSIPI